MYFTKTPSLLKSISSQLLWSVNTKDKIIFLTFDDGPHPEVTPLVLQQLKYYNAKATFFCVGENSCKHPDTLRKIVEEGHAIGNHTYKHLNGWKTKAEEYVKSVERCNQYVNANLFRPPYGRITPKQLGLIKKQFTVVMWDVLSCDFDAKVSKEECAEKVIHHAREGSIVVFHDSKKAQAKMLYALPKVLDYFTQKGYSFKSLYERSEHTTPE